MKTHPKYRIDYARGTYFVGILQTNGVIKWGEKTFSSLDRAKDYVYSVASDAEITHN